MADGLTTIKVETLDRNMFFREFLSDFSNISATADNAASIRATVGTSYSTFTTAVLTAIVSAFIKNTDSDNGIIVKWADSNGNDIEKYVEPGGVLLIGSDMNPAGNLNAKSNSGTASFAAMIWGTV